MAQRPPRSIPPGISLSRRLSERARAAAPQPTPTPTGAPEGGLGAIVEALQGALHGLIDKVSEAARSAGEAEAGKTERDDAAPGGNVRSGVHSIELGGKGARMVFGYTLRMGLDGVSAEPFGDVPDEAAARAAAASAAAPGARQPIVELFEEADAIVVVAELPGADPASLVCRIDGQTLLIEAAGTRRYRKQVALPAAVRPAEISRNFQNGILEVRLARAQPRERRGALCLRPGRDRGAGAGRGVCRDPARRRRDGGGAAVRRGRAERAGQPDRTGRGGADPAQHDRPHRRAGTRDGQHDGAADALRHRRPRRGRAGPLHRRQRRRPGRGAGGDRRAGRARRQGELARGGDVRGDSRRQRRAARPARPAARPPGRRDLLRADRTRPPGRGGAGGTPGGGDNDDHRSPVAAGRARTAAARGRGGHDPQPRLPGAARQRGALRRADADPGRALRRAHQPALFRPGAAVQLRPRPRGLAGGG